MAVKRKASAKQLAWRKKFAAMARAGTLKKKKRKTVKRKSAKRKTVKRKTIKRKVARKNPVRRKRPFGKRKVARRKPPTRRRRATTSRWVIKANAPVKSGYKFYYLRGNEFVLDPDHATKHSTVAACHKKMREIQPVLPNAISSISCMKI